MATLSHSEIDRMWDEDSKWNHSLNLDYESSRIDRLHAKWIRILRDESIHLHIIESELNELIKDKSYFWVVGHDETTRAKKWELFPGDQKALKSELKWVLPGDKQIIEMKGRFASQEAKVTMLISIVKQLSNRHWGIKNSMNWINHASGK